MSAKKKREKWIPIFLGNQNHDTPELRSMGPLLTRYVRIYPERATIEGLGLRLELLGCELDGEFPLSNESPPGGQERECSFNA
ncbi:Neuropilin-1 [Liparis tanakae]|uniref:Neuropilin-1 n=1 Tax=Liparis tanakae TaxID=230148 RepID=A0A4Z2G512_9TELE|nr:Neuropilin-1 [Liparis tanakae]